MSLTKRVSCSTLLLAIASLSFYSSVVTSAPKKPTGVILETAKLESVADEVEALGTLRANESVELTVNVTETVSSVLFTDGQRVKQGQVLVEMENAEEQAIKQEVQYTVEEAQSQLERIKRLAQRSDASQSVLDERQREFNVAKARMIAIESRLNDRVVTAPFSGLLGLRNISPGALVEAGDVITTLIDDSAMKLDFSVPSVFLLSLKPGMNIIATSPALADKEFKGTIQSLDNQVDPISRSIVVRAILLNKDGQLKPGLLMEVDLLTNERDAIVIPEHALVPLAKTNHVFVASEKDGELVAEKRKVEIGKRWQGEVEILSGLTEGERVVTEGTLKVRPGSVLKVVTDIVKE